MNAIDNSRSFAAEAKRSSTNANGARLTTGAKCVIYLHQLMSTVFRVLRAFRQLMVLTERVETGGSREPRRAHQAEQREPDAALVPLHRTLTRTQHNQMHKVGCTRPGHD